MTVLANALKYGKNGHTPKGKWCGYLQNDIR